VLRSCDGGKDRAKLGRIMLYRSGVGEWKVLRNSRFVVVLASSSPHSSDAPMIGWLMEHVH